MQYVIIGGGIAGISAAEAIRQSDRQGDITLIGDETELPYCRPMISQLLEGTIDADRLPIRRADYYDQMGISPILGSRATAVDAERKTIRIGNGETVVYDRLLIASGADPRPIKAEGMTLKHIFFMRTARQVQQMLSQLNDTRRALVLGGGLVGFKAAYGLIRRGIKVTMLIKSDYPLSLQIDAAAGKMVYDELVNQGLEVRVGLEVTAFEGKESVSAAHISDGTTMPCDLVVIGKGVLPALSFIPRDDIDVDLGIIVDDHMQTSRADVFAAGDVAEHVDVARRIRWVNAIWPEAVSQGRIAGMNMAGRPVKYRGSLSRNVIRMFDLDVMACGVVAPRDDGAHRSYQFYDHKAPVYRKLVFKDNLLVGFVMINRIDQGGVLVSLIQNRIAIRVPEARLLDATFNYRQLLPCNRGPELRWRSSP